MYITIIASLLSGIIATIITIIVNRRWERQRIKNNIAVELFGYRHQLLEDNDKTEELIVILNKIPIIFASNEKILVAYDKILSETGDKNDVLVTLIKEICLEAGINCENWNDRRILQVCNIKH